MRAALKNRSTLTNQFHMESTILRYIGGLTNEYATLEVGGKDYGAVGLGFTNNFAIGKLVLGKDSAGTVGFVRVLLQDSITNFPGCTPPEALYIDSLEMYGNSELCLNGIGLYYRNGGNWRRAYAGRIPNGDGTGFINAWWPARGTLVMVK